MLRLELSLKLTEPIVRQISQKKKKKGLDQAAHATSPSILELLLHYWSFIKLEPVSE